MGKHDDFDEEIKGQMSIDDLFSPPEKMVAVSNIFARARKNMSLAEQKTFILALSKIEWKKSPSEQPNIVELEKKVVEKVLGYKSDSTDLSQNVWNAIKDLNKHSHIEIADRDRGIYDSGMVVTRITMRKNTDNIRIKFEEEYLPLFMGLGSNYITMWSLDIFKMTSKRSVQFYELLRQMSYDKYAESPNVFSYGFGIKALKDMFDIPKEGKGSYMRAKGGFDRTNFEKKVIEPLCEDLAHCKMIQLIVQDDGKYYQKVKKGNRVLGYRIHWSLSKYPNVADAREVKEIAERVDKDPQLLKVSKDILKGEKKSKSSQNQGKTWGNIETSPSYKDQDFDELERQLLDN